MNLVLDALDQYLNSLPDTPVDGDGSRGMRIIAMVDEAHRVLGTKLPSLSNLVRMSRSKGGAVMLISQSALLMAWMPPPDGIAMCQCDAC